VTLAVRVPTELIEDRDRTMSVSEHAGIERRLGVEPATVDHVRGCGRGAQNEQDGTDRDGDGPAHGRTLSGLGSGCNGPKVEER
jgi:hypothetical protein